MKIFKLAQESENDYKGSHTAPVPDQGNSLHDLSNIFPDDIYGPYGARYYGHGESFDNQSINVIQKARNKPNLSLTVYRAVPDQNKKQIAELNQLISYFDQFKFFPVNNPIINAIEEKYPIEKYTYDEQQSKIYQELENKLLQLKGETSDIKINIGDWVTTSRSYAKLHGESTLRGEYKILSKQVKAKDLYTDGNSIHEWGYHPS